MWNIRKILANGDTQEATEQLLGLLVRTKNNASFIKSLEDHVKVMEFTAKNDRSMS